MPPGATTVVDAKVDEVPSTFADPPVAVCATATV
jgi:hypothetical protein